MGRSGLVRVRLPEDKDVYTQSKGGLQVNCEFYDVATTDYWTRGMYATAVPPGLSTITVPIGAMCVGEKSALGEHLKLAEITKWAIMINEKPAAPLLISNVRLERAVPKEDTHFDGLYAFDFQSDSSTPVMNGFTGIFPSSEYSEIKGFGLSKGTKTGPAGYRASICPIRFTRTTSTLPTASSSSTCPTASTT